MGSWLCRAVCCVLILTVTGCTGGEPRPSASPTSAATTAPSPVASESPTPSDTNPELRQAEQAVVRFWGVIDRFRRSRADITDLQLVARGRVATQWARNLNQYRYDGVRTKGEGEVLDPRGRRAATRDAKNKFLVEHASIEQASSFVDKDGKSAGRPTGPRRVSYDYTVEQDQQKWYVVNEKVTETC